MPSIHKVKFKSSSAAVEFVFGAAPSSEVAFLLKEDGDFLLQEDGFRLELDVPADEGFQNDQRRFAFASSSGTTLIENTPGTG